MGRVAQLIEDNLEVDFVDINMGCPIDSVCNRGMGSALATRPGRVQGVVRTMSTTLSCPLTVKMRIGYDDHTPTAHKLIPKLALWGASAVTLHGRTRQQRYSRSADWNYIATCAGIAKEQPLAGPAAAIDGADASGRDADAAAVAAIGSGAGYLPLIGNGDVFSHEDVHEAMVAAASAESESGGAANPTCAATSPLGGVSSVMLARGALVKPWVFREIKERRHWDISAAERLEYLRRWVRYGLEHWGTDARGVATTRNFLLEWLSFLYRYVPVGLLERLPARIQERPPPFVGRSDLETLMASAAATDWVKITEMLLGPVPDGFAFTPKHVANAYARDAGAAGANAAREAKVADWG
jgi:tRNA-dihydrouridine synthase 3